MELYYFVVYHWYRRGSEENAHYRWDYFGHTSTFTRPSFGADFNMPPLVTLLHITPGLLFMILGPFQFVKKVRFRFMLLHRLSGRIFVAASYFIGLSAIVMPFLMLPIGGLNEAVGSVFFALFFLTAITKSVRHILRKEIALHREWMLRAFSIGLAIASVRPIMALSFAAFHLQPKEFLGTAFWLGFTIHLIVAEIWINFTRPKTIIHNKSWV